VKIEDITAALERATDTPETTHGKLVRFGWVDDIGRELNETYWRRNARWPHEIYKRSNKSVVEYDHGEIK
jgi:hypothetical protein